MPQASARSIVAAHRPHDYDSIMPKAVVITISDSRSAGSAEDKSGPAAVACLVELGMDVIDRRVVPDDQAGIARIVGELAPTVALIVTTGGTGVGPRDVTPEAIGPLFDRELPGFGEIMRTGSFARTPLSILTRGGAGVIGTTLVVLLPGSPKAVRECLPLVGPAIRHVMKVLAREVVDCQADAGAHADTES